MTFEIGANMRSGATVTGLISFALWGAEGNEKK